jgi:NAD-dependent deacetylase
VLSGAGISAESGVPTFRDDKNGLWARFDPYELASIDGWLQNPQRVWGWYLWRHYLASCVEPNDGHRAIAAWQDHAEVTVVTQNVDNLHERAGSDPVHHVHGSIFEFRCAACALPYTGTLPEMSEPVLELEPPSCGCGGLIRPDVVWFGEQLPEAPWQRAVEATQSADLLVVVGTSAIVYPAAGLPELALARGATVIEVNPEPTPLSRSATICLRESASKVLPGLLQRLPALLN